MYKVLDCNQNGVPDSCDIAGGTSADLDRNAIPDECELVDRFPFLFDALPSND